MKIDRAITISRRRRGNPALTKLGLLLADAQIATEIKGSTEDACAVLLLTDENAIPSVLVDASSPADLAQLRATVPHIAPVAFAVKPPSDVVIEAFRAGAHDFLDVESESDASILSALERAAAETRSRTEQRKRLSGMRALIEDFLRVLVRTERRSLELEERLEVEEGGRAAAIADLDPDRAPRVLVVDDDDAVVDLLRDVLSHEGLRVIGASGGQEAIEIAEATRAEADPVDLLLIDKNLPDLDGIKVIGKARTQQPGLAAMVMTGFASTESAIDAADLGVVGYILKPFDDVASLVRRVREVATRATNDRRERRYLDLIKDRHSEFLLRYRQLVAQLDKMR